ncbi:MAG: DinB family protein [Candidatus Methylomirabilia bacterium]
MSLPVAVQVLWDELEEVRHEVLKEAEGLSQAQADWRPSERDWSIGEILHHLTLAEVNTGKLTTKLTRDADRAGTLAPFPTDLKAFEPLPPAPPGRAEAPPLVRPERGRPIGQVIADMKATREGSRLSIQKLALLDPRPLTWQHFALGELDLAQWWMLQARHDRDHLQQLRAIKGGSKFPKA